jgi:hypothetical protein
LSNDRILGTADSRVTFQWKDYRRKDRHKSRTMTVDAEEFIRRFLIHTLPEGFQRIRYFGLMANRHRSRNLALCRELIAGIANQLLPSITQCQILWRALMQPDSPLRCPECRKGFLIRIPIPADIS